MQALIESLTPMHLVYAIAGAVTLYYGLRMANQDLRSGIGKLSDRLDGMSEQARADNARLVAHEARTDTRIKALEDKSERQAIEAGRFEERLSGMSGQLSRIEHKIDKALET
jgi:cell division protein FtsB